MSVMRMLQLWSQQLGKSIRERMLAKRGIVLSIKRKTTAMKLLERQFGLSIEELIKDGKLEDVARQLGLEQSTISRWRKILGLRS